MMKKLKQYWIPILLLIICIPLMGKWGSGYYQYRQDLKIANDSIQALQKDRDIVFTMLRQRTQEYRRLSDTYYVYKQQMEITAKKRREDSLRHEIEIANLRHIPTDSLYLFVTKELNKLSFD